MDFLWSILLAAAHSSILTQLLSMCKNCSTLNVSQKPISIPGIPISNAALSALAKRLYLYITISSLILMQKILASQLSHGQHWGCTIQ
jgi:hypothetical protein